MRTEAVTKAAGAANVELNARERLKLAEWKLNDQTGTYPGPTGAPVVVSPTKTIQPIDTKLGADWNSGNEIKTGTAFTHQGKQITFTRADQPNENEPAVWTLTVT